jgi:hypothetical protein
MANSPGMNPNHSRLSLPRGLLFWAVIDALGAFMLVMGMLGLLGDPPLLILREPSIHWGLSTVGAVMMLISLPMIVLALIQYRNR